MYSHTSRHTARSTSKPAPKRPYVICHVISSLDGRISGSAFELAETIDTMDEHWRIRADFGCEAVLNGAITAAEIYAEGFLDDEELRECGIGTDGDELPRTDRIVETDLENYVVCVDPEGTLKWTRNYIERPVQPRSHVIEVLLETVSDAYLKYLRQLDISYIFAGRDELDVDLMMEKLVSSFGIERLLITGGGVMDWTMLRAGSIDEVSVIITPTVGGERDVATMFDRSYDPGAEKTAIDPGIALELIEVRQLDGGAIHLRYRSSTECDPHTIR